jgi:hypothetical protein
MAATPLERLLKEERDGTALLAHTASRAVDDRVPLDCSNLSAVGAPLELGFVWPRGELRVTVDPCPRASPCARAKRVITAAAGALEPSQWSVVDRVTSWHACDETRYGGWLGLRARGTQIRRKLYLEVPQGAPWQEWELNAVGKPAVLPHRDVRATMIGLDGDRGGFEVYYRCGRLFPAELDTLLRRFGLPERGAEITRAAHLLVQRTIRFELPSFDMGFSCALSSDGRAQAFTWYSTSPALLGPAARAREALLRVGRASGWDVDGYAALTEPAADSTVPHHGLVGMTIPRDGPMQVTATIAAVPCGRWRESLEDSVGEEGGHA